MLLQTVLPLYFKHSNFSSFARQLNFYGFRKLRTDPILTTDADPSKAGFVRFYHEKFQRDKPELLQQIRRATKADQTSKDDLDSLRAEVDKLKEQMKTMKDAYDRRLAELSYECNRRITSMNAEYDKLVALVHGALGQNIAPMAMPQALAPAAPAFSNVDAEMLHQLSQAAVALQHHLRVPVVQNASGKRPAFEAFEDGGCGDEGNTRARHN
jgi:hypothetical protein